MCGPGATSLHRWYDLSVMKSVTNHQPPDDPRSTAELFVLAKEMILVEDDEDEAGPTPGWQAMSRLHQRATLEVFETAARWSRSDDPVERQVAANVLAQIGYNIHAFQTESVALLIPMLADPDPAVIACVGVALGHRNDPLTIPHLLPLIDHPDSDVRFGVMAGLSALDDPRAIAGLITLSRDVDAKVRDWATFGLGDLTQVDTPELREALFARTQDTDHDTRGESLVGLANRHDLRVVEPLLRELRGEYHGTYAIEAAGTLGLPAFYEALLPLRTQVVEHNSWSLGDYEEALVACRPPTATDTPPRE